MRFADAGMLIMVVRLELSERHQNRKKLLDAKYHKWIETPAGFASLR
jgi:hypothetical protein